MAVLMYVLWLYTFSSAKVDTHRFIPRHKQTVKAGTGITNQTDGSILPLNDSTGLLKTLPGHQSSNTHAFRNIPALATHLVRDANNTQKQEQKQEQDNPIMPQSMTQPGKQSKISNITSDMADASRTVSEAAARRSVGLSTLPGGQSGERNNFVEEDSHR